MSQLFCKARKRPCTNAECLWYGVCQASPPLTGKIDRRLTRRLPPKGFGDLPPIETGTGFRMPTEKEMREGLGPNFKTDGTEEKG
jgi:hypothetical protein